MKAQAGLATLRSIREDFAGIGIRVDFHERFTPETFARLLPELEQLDLEWIEEPFAMGADFADLRSSTRLRVGAAAGTRI